MGELSTSGPIGRALADLDDAGRAITMAGAALVVVFSPLSSVQGRAGAIAAARSEIIRGQGLLVSVHRRLDLIARALDRVVQADAPGG